MGPKGTYVLKRGTGGQADPSVLPEPVQSVTARSVSRRWGSRPQQSPIGELAQELV